MDEVDHLFSDRSSSQSEGMKSIRCCLRASMSRLMAEKDLKVIFIATTNSIQVFDDAFLRRFPFRAYVRLPDRGALLALLKQHLGDYELDSDITPEKLHDLATTLATKRSLSAFDVRRALTDELKFSLTGEWFRATHFKEVREDKRLLSLLNNGHYYADMMEQETLGGQKILMPCSPSERGAFECKHTDLSEEQTALLRMKVKMADVERIMDLTMERTTKSTINRFNHLNSEIGTRVEW